MYSEQREQLIRSLHDPDYRKQFAEAHVATGLGFQIHLLREHRGWTQAELGEQTGKAQGTISQLEDPDYGKHTLRTLKTLAEAFDVALLVRYVPFSELVDWTVNLTTQRLTPPSFDEEFAGPSLPQAAISTVGVHGDTTGIVNDGERHEAELLDQLDASGSPSSSQTAL